MKNYETLDNISTKPNQAKIETLVLKVITVSRVIITAKGRYQICNVKDSTGDSGTLNIYSNYVNRLEPFSIYTFKNLKKGEVTKSDETKMRLHTTNFTKIESGSSEDVINFTNVSNGDETIIGQIVACGEVSLYKSCKLHYKKVDEENTCPKCESQLTEKDLVIDFRLEIYLEVHQNNDEEEIDVKEIMVFKRVLNSMIDDCQEKDIDQKVNNQLTGKTAKVDYKIDEADRLIAVSLAIVK